MDYLHALIGAALAEEDSLLRDRTSNTQAFERETIYTAAIGSLIALALLIAAAILLVKNNVELAKSEAVRSHQADVLQATLDSLRDGVAVFETDGSLAAFNGNFFQLLEFPAALSHFGAKLNDFRAVDEKRGSRIFSGADGDAGVRRLVIAGRELDLYRSPYQETGF